MCSQRTRGLDLTETSDPASELHKLCTRLKLFHFKGTGALALSECFAVTPNSSDYYELLGQLAGRFTRLRGIFESALDDPVKSLGIKALEHLQSFLSAQRQQQPWAQVKESVFDDANMNTLLMSSIRIGQVAPIIIPSEEERTGAIEKIDAALQALSPYHGSISTALYSSLASMKRILVRFDVYGVDAFTDEFLRAFAVQSAADREVNVPAPERRARSGAWATISMVAALMVGSDAALTAIENHYSRAEKVVQTLLDEQKLLPPPVPTDEPKQSKIALPAEGNGRARRFRQ